MCHGWIETQVSAIRRGLKYSLHRILKDALVFLLCLFSCSEQFLFLQCAEDCRPQPLEIVFEDVIACASFYTVHGRIFTDRACPDNEGSQGSVLKSQL